MASATPVDSIGGTSASRRFGGSREHARTARRLRVLCVDVHDVVHWGFRALMTAETWVERYLAAASPVEAVELARKYEPHVALVDLVLGNESGSELCTRLRAESPTTGVLLMAGWGRISVHAARAVGAFGVVPKDWPIHDIAAAARMIGLGMTLFSPDAQRPTGLLSEREREVLDLIALGATNREIADALYISHHTVKAHTSALYRKVRARNRAEAILRAQRLGLLA